jgi:hypothetical protein
MLRVVITGAMGMLRGRTTVAVRGFPSASAEVAVDGVITDTIAVGNFNSPAVMPGYFFPGSFAQTLEHISLQTR